MLPPGSTIVRESGAALTDDTLDIHSPLPDPQKCRTRYLGQTFPFSDCLVETLDGCEYRVRFGISVYCYHPDRRHFEKTVALDASQQPVPHQAKRSTTETI